MLITLETEAQFIFCGIYVQVVSGDMKPRLWKPGNHAIGDVSGGAANFCDRRCDVWETANQHSD